MPDASSSTVVNDLLSRVEAIRPIIEKHRDANEQARQLADPVYDAMVEAGLFRMGVPTALGGYELHPSDAYRVYYAVSRIDTAAGWNLLIGGFAASFGAVLGEDGIAEIFANGPDVIGAGAVFPPAAAIRAPGGWRVTGRCPFASGSSRAAWVVMGAIEMDGDVPRIDPATGAPTAMAVLIPRSDVEVIDTWHTLGMRGTGSHDIAVDDVFVPDRRVGIMGVSNTPPALYSGTLYKLTPFPGVHGEAIPSIAAAENAADALAELALAKVPNFSTTRLADRELLQMNLGKARSLVGAAKAYLHSSIESAYASVEQTGSMSSKEKADCQLAACFAAESSARAVDLVYEAAGSTGFRTDKPFERLFRDAHTLTQHASKSVLRYASVSKMELGLPQDWFALAL